MAHLLALAKELLAAHLDLNATIAAVAAAPVPRLAAGCTVFMWDENRVLRARLSRHLDERVKRALVELGEAYDDAQAPLRRALSHTPVVIGWETYQPPDPLTAAAVRVLEGRPWLVIPFQDHQGQDLGALRLVVERPADESAIAWARDLAEVCGPAIGRALRASATRGALDTLAGGLGPDPLPIIPGFELEARYLPGTVAARIGGDWYQVLPHGDRVILAIGDAAGHGAGAAVAMAQASSALRAFVVAGRPRRALENVDQYLHSLIGSALVTLCMVDVKAKTRRARLANAGHVPPIVARRTRVRRLDRGRSAPLGMGTAERARPVTVRFRRGDRLFLYTDGLVERRGDTLDHGIARLLWVVQDAPQELPAACDYIVEHMRPEAGFEDDVALLGVRFTKKG